MKLTTGLVLCLILAGCSGGYMNVKFITSGQSPDNATVIPFVLHGYSLSPDAPTDSTGVRDSSLDWRLAVVGHPKEYQKPETYIARIRRPSDDAIMRDIPVTPGIQMAAIFTGLTGSASINNNNLYGTNDLAGGSVRTVQEIKNTGTVINAALSVPNVNDSVGFQLGGTKWELGAIYLSSTEVDIYYRDWSAGSATHVHIPAVGGVAYVRIVSVGSELRLYFAGSPITATRPPDAILSDVPDFPSPSYLYASIIGDTCKAENVTIGGMDDPQTIYTLEQQTIDNGSGMTTIDVEWWQASPIPGVQGFTIRQIFP